MGDQLPLPLLLLPLAGLLLQEVEQVGLREAPLLLRVALGTVRGPRSDQPLVELVAPSLRSGSWAAASLPGTQEQEGVGAGRERRRRVELAAVEAVGSDGAR